MIRLAIDFARLAWWGLTVDECDVPRAGSW